jgi:hypothetical protein
MKVPDELALAYLHKTQPVQWVGWYLAVQDAKAKSALRTVLFESATDSLRDLTADSIRALVVNCVLKHKSLRRMVVLETDAVVEAIQKHSLKDH